MGRLVVAAVQPIAIIVYCSRNLLYVIFHNQIHSQYCKFVFPLCILIPVLSTPTIKPSLDCKRGSPYGIAYGIAALTKENDRSFGIEEKPNTNIEGKDAVNEMERSLLAFWNVFLK